MKQLFTLSILIILFVTLTQGIRIKQHYEKCDKLPCTTEKCKTCDKDICSECITGYYLEQDLTCVEICKPGSYVDQKVTPLRCKDCSMPKCKYCANNECSECDQGFVFHNKICVAECKIIGEFRNPSTGECQPCSVANCKTCPNNSACLDCVDKFYPFTKIGGTLECVPTCPKDTILQEVVESHGEHVKKCQYIIPPQGEWEFCAMKACSTQSCSKCSDKDKCEECFPEKYLEYDSKHNDCVDTCKDGFFDFFDEIKKGICQPCGDQECELCPQNKCTKCKYGLLLIGGKCLKADTSLPNGEVPKVPQVVTPIVEPLKESAPIPQTLCPNGQIQYSGQCATLSGFNYFLYDNRKQLDGFCKEYDYQSNKETNAVCKISQSSIESHPEHEQRGDFVFHTGLDQNAWWQLDIGKLLNIKAIVLKNRVDVLPERINPSIIEILDTQLKVVWKGNIKSTDLVYTFTDINISGMFIKVTLQKKDYLHFASLRAYY